MYKVVVVERDASIRKSTLDAVNWESEGYIVVGEAENGKNALEIIRETKTDLVLTDTELPEMDGISLATALEEFPWVRVVFLADYDAVRHKTAVQKRNVLDFICRPVSMQELCTVLKSAHKRLDDERLRQHEQELEKSRRYVERSAHKAGMMYSVMWDGLKKDKIKKLIDRHDLHLKGESHLVFLVSIDESTLPKNAFQAEVREFLLSVILGTVHRKADGGMGVEAFIHNGCVVAILSDMAKTIQNDTGEIIEELKREVSTKCYFSVRIGVSKPFFCLTKTAKAFHQSAEMLYNQMCFNGKTRHGKSQRGKTESSVAGRLRKIEFVAMIQSGKKKELSEYLHRVVGKLMNENTSLGAFELCFIGLCYFLYSALHESEEDLAADLGDSMRCLFMLFRQESIESIRCWFENQCYRVMDIIESARGRGASVTDMKRVMTYIDENFCDSSMTLLNLGEYFHITPNYLGTMIKEMTGESFSNYVTGKRLKKGHDLLIETEKSIHEVAIMVGYSKGDYFSSCFKKHYGISPSQVRVGKRSQSASAEAV